MARLPEPPVLPAAGGGWAVDLTRGVVQVLNARGGPAGSGFLVGERLLVTCAHVVGSDGGREPPPEPATVVFPHLDNVPRTARVEPALWRARTLATSRSCAWRKPPPRGEPSR